MPFVILLNNDFIRFTRLSAQRRKSLPKSLKNDDVIEEGKGRYFCHCGEAKKKQKNSKGYRGRADT
jgi:hypothetical protein